MIQTNARRNILRARKILFFGLLALTMGTHVVAATPAENASVQENTVDEKEKEEYLLFQEQDRKIAEEYLKSEEDIQYFAYLNLDEADDELKPVILAARNRIISRYSWVADDLNGWVMDSNGNIEEEVPHFSDIFPEDWDVPVYPVIVDLSYYQP